MEASEEKHSKCRRMKKYAFGVIVIIAGFLLLLTNIEVLPYSIRHIFFSWQMLLIVIGVVSLFGKESHLPGSILILVGVFFILPRVFPIPFSMTHLFWPVIIIAIGLIILFKGFGRNLFGHREGSLKLEDGFIREENVFGGSKQRVTHESFKGGTISCIFGGSEIDLSQARLAPGEHTLEINAIFGGATVVVPADWKIILKNSAILGGFADKRTYIKESPDPSRVLIIKANAIFGGGEIKSY